MPLSDTLARIPGLAGYLAQQQMARQQEHGELAQTTGLMGLIQAAQKQRQEQELRAMMAQGGSPEQMSPRLMQMGPQGLELAAKLKGLLPKPAEPYTLGVDQERYGPDNKLRARGMPSPAPRPLADNRPELLRLQEVLETLPPDAPQRVPIQKRMDFLSTRAPNAQPQVLTLMRARDEETNPEKRRLLNEAIKKLTTHQPAVNVYSGSLTPAVDAQGNPVFVQPSGREGVGPRIVEGAYPPEKAAAAKERVGAQQSANTLANVETRIARMSNLIKRGSVTGGVVGPLGLAGRVAETARGAVQPDAPTPSIDYQNEMRLLLSDVRKIVEKDPNLSKDEREAMYETLGGGIMQTPGSALRTLTNVVEKVKNSAVAGGARRAPRSRFTAGEVYVDKDGNRAEYMPDGTWKPR